ncbi:glycoside hydrolase family 38 C-terminal domain-containing protein [Paenibacillus gorillae]|uniref:glycoside hydrolase family 38 N-terminal domain-containing protein n=1 Tax=Paenibacillus gorillae TaxID=1243662 RepID=UPI0004AEDA23|nr:alpha-mannosidase [Paenibacillus gorillae]
MRKLHLLSNAHLDPVWQWEWEEGAAAAVSTFRAAADFCEEYDGYIFNHNEVILYKWVEEYEPSLFQRIQELVKLGKWHIMGGWYLQPDCNMPSGESFVRQILLGRSYFYEKFGVRPTTAINFDSFGHTRGLVQIMQQAGYDSYVFYRPENLPQLPARDFIWNGFNDSKVMGHKVADSYSSLLGKAHEKISKWLEENPQTDIGLLLWGVGNHGGGPSRIDLNAIGELMKETSDVEISHSTPEQYFAELKEQKTLPEFSGDLNPRFVGCYTSMIRVKQKHRQLENELFMTEKMLAAAEAQGLLTYPKAELHEALCDLMTAQFHDILPGSSIQPAEEASLRQMEHGLEIAARLRTRAFFALSAGQPKAALKEYPVLVYNPHPYPVKHTVECEFMLEDQNWAAEFSLPVAYRNGVRLASQPEKELSNLNLDWRKRVVFEAVLEPSSMNRFDCRIEMLGSKPAPQLKEEGGRYTFENSRLRVVINSSTGLMDEYTVDGVSLLQKNAFLPLVIQDNEDPWRMDTNTFPQAIGSFSLLDPGRGTDFSGVKGALLPSVRVIEDGEVRTVIEAVFGYKDSFICQTYKLPKNGTEIEVQIRVYWNEKDKMLKLSVPTALKNGVYRGQTAFGINELAADGTETVSQRWVSAEEASDHEAGGLAITCINDGIYGSDFRDGEIRFSLLRGVGYCAHPIGDLPIMVQDRFLPRIDQGERRYTFWLNGGGRNERLENVDREAMVKNERPYALSFFPSGDGELPGSFVQLKDDVIQMSALKKEEQGDDYILRLFEPTGSARSTVIEIPSLNIAKEIRLNGFEIKTYVLRKQSQTLEEAALCEGL